MFEYLICARKRRKTSYKYELLIQARELEMKLSIYQKNAGKNKNMRTLLAHEQDDIEFYKKLSKNDSHKAQEAKHAGT